MHKLMFLASPVSLRSLQVQKKNYREEKKRATKELLSTITDPSVIVMADWLKVGASFTPLSIFVHKLQIFPRVA